MLVPPCVVPSVPEIVANVEVAVHVGTPFTSARTNPLVPVPYKVDVEIAVGAAELPVPFAITVPAAWFASWVSASVPEIVESVEVAAA